MNSVAEVQYQFLDFWTRFKRAAYTLGIPIAVAAILPIAITVLAALSWTLIVAILAAVIGWGTVLYLLREQADTGQNLAQTDQYAASLGLSKTEQYTPEKYIPKIAFFLSTFRGFVERDTAELEQALAMYRAALQERVSEASLTRTTTLLDLAGTLVDLGQRTGDRGQLEEAIVAFHSALSERSDTFLPLHRALITARLGQLLHIVAQRSGTAERMEEAVKMYRIALREFRHDQTPHEWAATLNSLAIALWELSRLRRNALPLKDAIESYRAVELVRERAPMEWAIAQLNLGALLWSLGDRASALEAIARSTEFFRENIEKEIAAPYYFAHAVQLRNVMASALE
jgi:tetratricopeptide (TPR) repeat protein